MYSGGYRIVNLGNLGTINEPHPGLYESLLNEEKPVRFTGYGETPLGHSVHDVESVKKLYNFIDGEGTEHEVAYGLLTLNAEDVETYVAYAIFINEDGEIIEYEH